MKSSIKLKNWNWSSESIEDIAESEVRVAYGEFEQITGQKYDRVMGFCEAARAVPLCLLKYNNTSLFRILIGKSRLSMPGGSFFVKPETSLKLGISPRAEAEIKFIGYCYNLSKENNIDSAISLDLKINDINNLDEIYTDSLHLIRNLKIDISSTNLKTLFGIDIFKNLKSLEIISCDNLIDFSSISSLRFLENISIENCKHIKDLNFLKELVNLSFLKLNYATGLIDISALSKLHNLINISLIYCKALRDVSLISDLLKISILNLEYCESITDIPLINSRETLKCINLKGLEKINNLNSLSALSSLESIQFTSRRIQSVETLRGISSLREVKEFNPPEVAELLAHTAWMRTDRDCIAAKGFGWLNEAKTWIQGDPLLQDRFAATLGEAFSLLGETPIEHAYDDFINSRPDFTSAPWKAWFGGTLKETSFELYRKRVERISVASMLPGAIGGACATLPHEENAEWSRQWLAHLEEARLSDAKALLNVAPEICLAHARLGEIEALGRWLVSFTDPSDPAALDPVQAALAKFQLAMGDLPAAENHIFAIQSPKLRDPVLADLVTALSESEAEDASAKLLLIDAAAIRVEQAKRLAAKPNASETTLHRLAVATGDSPADLAELITAIPDPANKTLLETLSTKLQSDRSTTLRKIAEDLQKEVDRCLLEAAQN